MAIPSTQSHDGTFSVGDLGPVLRRWWWLMLPPFVVAMAVVSLVTSRVTPTYRAEAEVVIRTEESANLFPLSEETSLLRSPSAEDGFLSSTEYVSTSIQSSNPSDRVVIDVGNVAGRVEPSFISFTATGHDPESVSSTATAWAQTYIELRHERDVAELSQTIDTLTQTLEGLQEERNEFFVAVEPIDRLLATIDDPTEVAQLTTQRLAILQSLETQLAPVEAQLDAVNAELGNLLLVQNFLTDETVSARMNRVPDIPTSPVSPSLPQNLAFGIVAALLLGAAAVLAAESMDDRVRTTDQLSTATGLAYLTTVPLNKSDDGSALVYDHGPVAESFQRLASAIDFARVSGGKKQVLMFTSARASEGKTTTVARLGAVLARQGRSVVVVGADMRRPTLSGRFGIPAGPGLAEHLGGLYLADGITIEVPEHRGLHIIRAGTLLDDRSPAELLRSPQMAELIESLREQFDHVLIDCPPVLPVVDALEIATLSDGIVLHAFASLTRQGHFEDAIDLIRRSASVPVLGYVLTGVSHSRQARVDSYYSSTRAPRSMSSSSQRVRQMRVPDLDLVQTEQRSLLPTWEGPDRTQGRVLAARAALDGIEPDLDPPLSR